MRILHIIAEITKRRGGPTTALNGLLEITGAAGIESSVLFTGDGTDEANLPEDVSLHRFPGTFPRRFLRSAGALRWLRLHHADYDLIILHEIWPLIILEAGRFLDAAGANYLVLPHNSLDPHDLKKKKWLKMVLGPVFVRNMLSGAKSVWGGTRRECERFITYGTLPPVEVRPFPVPDQVRGGDRAGFRERFGITSDEVVVLFLGRLDGKKGIDFLLRAVASLGEEFPEIRLVVAGGGDGSREAEWHSLAGDLKLGDRAVFTGFLAGSERADAFAAADLFALPSRYESFGIAVVEAMHAGLPVLISNEVFLADEVAAAFAGEICLPDARSVEEHLRTMLRDPELLRSRVANGREFAKKFLPQVIAEPLIGSMKLHAGSGVENPSWK